MGTVVLPSALTSGTTAFGSDVLANDTAIITQVNGNITNINIATGAAIEGTKLSNTAGLRVPGDRIEDGAITNLKLGPLAVADANIAVGAVSVTKLAAQAVISPKVKVTFFDWAPGGSLVGGATDSISTGVIAANVVPLMLQTRNAGVPSQTTASFSLGLHLNTATGIYYFTMINADNISPNHSRVGLTFRFLYIPLS